MNAICSEFAQNEGFKLFNIRFLPQDLHMSENYRLINDTRIGRSHRYELMYKRADIGLAIPIDGTIAFEPDPYREPDANDTLESTVYERTPRPVENVYLHKKVRDRLKNHLIDKYGFCICKECKTGQGISVDLVRVYNDMKIYYKVKVYTSIKACIREALGQLLEYSDWPDSNHAKALVIVGLASLCHDSKSYLQALRSRYQLPIYYQKFDLDKKEIIDGDFSDEFLG